MTDSAGPVIRPMLLEDLPDVMVIEQACFSVPWSARSYRFELLENPVASLYVAVLAGRVAGYIGLWELVGEGHISTLAVHPDLRQRGIGQALLVHGLGALAQHGLESATLEVRASNEAAQALYRKWGFVQVGRRRGYYRDNREDAILMTLERIRQAIEGQEVDPEFRHQAG
ncbi:MAG TPA: ribosomal protein S18-alanine N-acetyltransferase [Anaerolineales bacterium]